MTHGQRFYSVLERMTMQYEGPQTLKLEHQQKVFEHKIGIWVCLKIGYTFQVAIEYRENDH